MAGVPARVHGEHGRDVGDLDGSSARYQRVRRVFRPFVTRYIALVARPRMLSARAHRRAGGADRADLQRRRHRALSSRAGGRGADRRLSVPGRRLLAGRHRRPAWRRSRIRPTWRAASSARFAPHPEARARMRLVLVGDGKLRERGRGDPRRPPACASWRGSPASGPTSSRCCRVSTASCCRRWPKGCPTRSSRRWRAACRSIATRVGANAELVEEDVTGRTVPAGDSAALAREIGAYFAAPALARQHGQRGAPARRTQVQPRAHGRGLRPCLRRTASTAGGPAAPGAATAAARPRARG